MWYYLHINHLDKAKHKYVNQYGQKFHLGRLQHRLEHVKKRTIQMGRYLSKHYLSDLNRRSLKQNMFARIYGWDHLPNFDLILNWKHLDKLADKFLWNFMRTSQLDNELHIYYSDDHTNLVLLGIFQHIFSRKVQ